MYYCAIYTKKKFVKKIPKSKYGLVNYREEKIISLSDIKLETDNDELFEAFMSDVQMNLDRQKGKELFDKMLIKSALRY